MRVFWRGIMTLAQVKMPESSALAAVNMTFLIIWAMVRTGLFKHSIANYVRLIGTL